MENEYNSNNPAANTDEDGDDSCGDDICNDNPPTTDNNNNPNANTDDDDDNNDDNPSTTDNNNTTANTDDDDDNDDDNPSTTDNNNNPTANKDDICDCNPPTTDIDNRKITRNDFPDDFIFGTGTSAYQHEGGATKGGRGISIWDKFTLNTPGRIADGCNGNLAVDMYNKFKEDTTNMKKMGFDAYRLSISWSRILPGGRREAGISREGINYYNEVIDTLIANG